MLNPGEVQVFDRLMRKRTHQWGEDKKHWAYYDGSNRLAQLGIAIPDSLSMLETVVNWPQVVVEAIGERSDVKTIRRSGNLEADENLLGIFEANNMDTQMAMFTRDKLIYGRSFLSVGVNPDDQGQPTIMVESPREITVEVDRKRRAISAALRLVSSPADHDVEQDVSATLYLPNQTIWLDYVRGRWVETGRNVHSLGRVPLVMCLNRQETGEWLGRSEMRKIIPVTDSTVRTLTNLQFAIEAAAVPRKFVVGASEKDFVGPDGQQKTQWESYFSSVWALANKDAKVGQLAGADLKGFHETVDLYGRLAASVTGFPPSYFGLHTANPPAEGAIRATEARLVKTVERSNSETGKALAWALDLAETLQGGDPVSGNRTVVEFHDPGTPTFAQRADALTKMAGGVPIISREGAWDELGWSAPRMERERERFAIQDQDPAIQALNEKAEFLG